MTSFFLKNTEAFLRDALDIRKLPTRYKYLCKLWVFGPLCLAVGGGVDQKALACEDVL